jgi:hypothetical protein
MKVVNNKGLKAKTSGDSTSEQDVANAAVMKFLNDKYAVDSAQKLEIKHLWDSYYRLNFWAEVERPKGEGLGKRIVNSRFVKATCDAQGKCQVDEKK